MLKGNPPFVLLDQNREVFYQRIKGEECEQVKVSCKIEQSHLVSMFAQSNSDHRSIPSTVEHELLCLTDSIVVFIAENSLQLFPKYLTAYTSSFIRSFT